LTFNLLIVLPFKLVFWWPLKYLILLPITALFRLLSQPRPSTYNQSAPDITAQFKAKEKDSFRHIAQLEQVKALDPLSFERFVGAAFEQLGYTVSTTALTGDEGVDLIIRKGNILGIVQCKRYDGSVGAPIIRDLYGSMIHNSANEAYLVTTGTVTQPAREWCEGKPIRLIDSTNLISWLESAKETEIRRQQEARAATVSSPSSTNVSKTSWQFPTSLRPSSKTFAYIATLFLGFASAILGLFGCLFILLPLSGATTSDGRRLTIGEGVLTSSVCFIPAAILVFAAVSTWYLFVHRQAAKRETRHDTASTEGENTGI
jgi:restriction system protein